MVSWQPGIFLPFLLEMMECSLSFVLLSKKEFYSSLSKIIILLSCNSIDYVHCRTVIHTNIFFHAIIIIIIIFQIMRQTE
jgi:hypothetical protein